MRVTVRVTVLLLILFPYFLCILCFCDHQKAEAMYEDNGSQLSRINCYGAGNVPA